MSETETKVQQMSATRDVLLCIAKLAGSTCVNENLAFTKCKTENADPEACLHLGEAVLACHHNLLQNVASKSKNEFEDYRKCMDKTQMNAKLCRELEKTFLASYFASDGLDQA